jgi:D-alanyl-D-alanine carboxypeptidase
MRITTPYRTAATTLATALAGLAFTIPAAGASTPKQDTLQDRVNAIQSTGTAGVLAEVTGARGQRYATAGQASTETGAPVRPYDKFRIGSATKTFIATVVLQLVGEGRLSLNDTAERWLPGVVTGHGNDGSKITIRELLQHTSGLYNYTADLPEIASTAGFQAGRFTTYTPAQLVAIAMRHKPDFAPGTSWEYSNTNYILAGMIINKVTGHSWEQEVNERIIQPLGLRQTITPGTYPYIPGPHMDGYSNFGSGPAINVTANNMSWGDAAGAIISTTADLTRFYSALLGGRLLRPAQLAEMQTTVPAREFDPIWPGARDGLGLLWIPLTCGGGYFSHGGDANGYSTRDGITPDGRRIAVVEETGDGDTSGLVTEHAMDALVDQELCGTGSR